VTAANAFATKARASVTKTSAFCSVDRRPRQPFEHMRTAVHPGTSARKAGSKALGGVETRVLPFFVVRMNLSPACQGVGGVRTSSGPAGCRWGGELVKNIIGLAFVLAIPVAFFADNANDANKELEMLEGKWKAVAMEAGGEPFSKENVPDFTFIVAAGGKATGQSPQGEYQATITVDPKKRPKTIDNLHESGAQKGKTQYGIYELEGDTWTVCMTLPGVAEGDRPKTFDTEDTANVVFVFERLEDDKVP
jgi:uncharacterized protein (TIGR03067 family)